MRKSFRTEGVTRAWEGEDEGRTRDGREDFAARDVERKWWKSRRWRGEGCS